tara:strand:+ start:4476 stop:5090 length:615 start_codon:yes stop_codon:yes gene_type:complete
MSAPTVFLDGEPVSFDGPLPESAQQLFGLLAEALEPSGKCLTAFSVDGTDYTQQPWPERGVPYARVLASSQRQEALMLDLIEQALPKVEAAEEGAQVLGVDVLSREWAYAQASAKAWGEQLAPVIELLEVLVKSIDAWGLTIQAALVKQLEEASQGLDSYMRAMETMDGGRLAEQALFTWQPWCARLRQSLVGPFQQELKHRLA